MTAIKGTGTHVFVSVVLTIVRKKLTSLSYTMNGHSVAHASYLNK